MSTKRSLFDELKKINESKALKLKKKEMNKNLELQIQEEKIKSSNLENIIIQKDNKINESNKIIQDLNESIINYQYINNLLTKEQNEKKVLLDRNNVMIKENDNLKILNQKLVDKIKDLEISNIEKINLLNQTNNNLYLDLAKKEDNIQNLTTKNINLEKQNIYMKDENKQFTKILEDKEEVIINQNQQIGDLKTNIEMIAGESKRTNDEFNIILEVKNKMIEDYENKYNQIQNLLYFERKQIEVRISELEGIIDQKDELLKNR